VTVSSTVLKFGGTSVEDAAAFERVRSIVSARLPLHPVVVVSALSRATDALLASVDTRSTDGLAAHFERHRSIARHFLTGGELQNIERDLDSARDDITALILRLERDPSELAAIRDEVVSFGERLSSVLLAAVLRAGGISARAVDARRCVVTDATHGKADPDLVESERCTRAELMPLVQEGEVPVLGGFIGRAKSGVTTTLGRGGSDYTAALVGAALESSEIQIWTDVSGVLTADPRVVKNARTIPSLSYSEASELAYFGAKVLHPKTIQPALSRGIPVRIVNSRVPDDPGTVVANTAELWPGAVKSIAHKSGITVLQITSPRMLGAYGFLRAVFEVFDRHRMPVDVVTTSEVSLSVTVEDGAGLAPVVADLEALGDVTVESRRAIICVVGEGLRTTPGIAARLFETIRDINVSLISQGASRVNITFVVDEDQVRETVSRLHAALLDRPGLANSGGPRGTGPRIAGAPRSAGGPVELARQLIDIPSVSGDEEEVAGVLAIHLQGLGYDVDVHEAAPGRPVIFAHTDAPARIVFCTHTDTVSPFFPSSEDGGYLYGRGACDAKGIIAAQVAAAERLRAQGIQEIGLLFVPDEEKGSIGARAANALPAARHCRYVIVGEPTENRLAIGSKGSLRVTLWAEGTGGHSAYPERGRSAIHLLLDVLRDLRAISWPRDSYFGETTCNIGVIGGGVGANVIAPDAHADLHIRLVTDDEPIRELLERTVDGRVRVEYLSHTPPVRLMSVPGFEHCVVGFTTDIPHLSNWGTPLLFGPGSIHDAHTARERISRGELERGIELYTRLGRALLPQDGATRIPATGTGGGS